MRQPIQDIAKLGPLPNSASANISKLESFQKLLTQIEQPVTDDEARLLSKLFGPDECFGLAWTLLHIIETAPGWPLRDVLSDVDNEWIFRMKKRADMC